METGVLHPRFTSLSGRTIERLNVTTRFVRVFFWPLRLLILRDAATPLVGTVTARNNIFAAHVVAIVVAVEIAPWTTPVNADALQQRWQVFVFGGIGLHA